MVRPLQPVDRDRCLGGCLWRGRGLERWRRRIVAGRDRLRPSLRRRGGDAGRTRRSHRRPRIRDPRGDRRHPRRRLGGGPFRRRPRALDRRRAGSGRAPRRAGAAAGGGAQDRYRHRHRAVRAGTRPHRRPARRSARTARRPLRRGGGAATGCGAGHGRGADLARRSRPAPPRASRLRRAHRSARGCRGRAQEIARRSLPRPGEGRARGATARAFAVPSRRHLHPPACRHRASEPGCGAPCVAVRRTPGRHRAWLRHRGHDPRRPRCRTAPAGAARAHG